MTQRTQYLIQILDKIGGPLMDAVSAVPNPETAESIEGDAQTIAGLLGKVVEVSISMNEALDLNAQDAQDDALRVALAALAGPLVAGQYRQNARIPQDNDLKRLGAAMQAVLTFGDNFTPSPEHEARLKAIEAEGKPVDAHQISIQYVHAFIPVINAVGAFPFGRPEQKLIMDVSGRLVNRAVEMRESLLPALSGDDQKLAELAILRALTSVYAACHTSETQRLAGMSDQTPDASSMEPVWQNFDTRSAMLEAVVKNILPADSAAPVAAAPTTPPVASPPAAEAPQDTAAKPAIFGGGTAAAATPEPPAPADTPPAASETPAPPATPPPSEQPPAQGGNPMAFFGTPKEGGEAPPSPPEPPPITPPPTQEPPPASPAAAPETPPPADPPAQPPPATPAVPPPEADKTDGSSGGSPMSFFTKKDEEE